MGRYATLVNQSSKSQPASLTSVLGAFLCPCALIERCRRDLSAVTPLGRLPLRVAESQDEETLCVVLLQLDTARNQAGLPEVRVHDLRHSTASFLVNSGRSLYEVQKILGHTQLKTTQRYSHLSQETLLEAMDSLAGLSGLSGVVG